MFRKIRIIVNTTARSYKYFRDARKDIERMANERGIELDIVETRRGGDAEQLAKEAVQAEYELVIGAGGDGTLYEIINGLKDSQTTTLGIIPIGTSNVFASEMRIPKDPIEAFSLCLSETPQKIDIGQVNGRRFIFTAGCGLDSMTVKNVDFKLKNLLGRPFFVFMGIKSFFSYSFPELRIHFPKEGIIEAGYQIIVNNIKYYGGNYLLAPRASVFDGLLDVIILKRKDVFSNLRYLLSVPLEEHLRYRDVAYYQVSKLVIKSERPLPIHLDSEIAASTPAEIEVLSGALSVILPKTV